MLKESAIAISYFIHIICIDDSPLSVKHNKLDDLALPGWQCCELSASRNSERGSAHAAHRSEVGTNSPTKHCLPIFVWFLPSGREFFGSESDSVAFLKHSLVLNVVWAGPPQW